MKQIGLNLVTIDGYVIKQLRTFIFRCYSCFKTTSIMTKIFCPNCGNKTLKKVAVSLDENGKQVIHINFRRRLTGKGKKVSDTLSVICFFNVYLFFNYPCVLLYFQTKKANFMRTQIQSTSEPFLKIKHSCENVKYAHFLKTFSEVLLKDCIYFLSSFSIDLL